MLSDMNPTAIAATVVAVATLLMQPPGAQACTCVGPINTCGALTAAADSVFEATVDSIRLVPLSTPPLATGAASLSTFSNNVRRVTLRDVSAWRGAASTTVLTAADGAACGYEFQIGIRYLIVAARTTGGDLAVSRCGLTRPLSEAGGLINYLRLPRTTGSRPPIRVWGQVMRATRWVDFTREYTGVPDAQVTLEGPTRRSIRTGSDGRFVVDDLPAGRYTATVTAPSTMPLGQVQPWDFELGTTSASACLELDFLAPIDSSISGVVVDERGQPVGGVFVTLHLPDQRDYSRGRAGGGYTTDAQGRYEFKDLPPGRYAIGLHESSDSAATTIASLRLGERLVLKPLIVRRLGSDRR
jgi:hypothetical protein